MEIWEHIRLGVAAVFFAPPHFELGGVAVSATVPMVVGGFVFGIVVGAIPGLAGPMAMAVSLPILIAAFGVNADALLPVLGFLIGIMKGATLGGAVPAILFNTPGTPDALLTARDGYPMAQKGEAGRALRIAHFSSASGDTFSDIVLFVCAPFLAVVVEAYLDLPEKTALILLSLSFIAAVSGRSAAKGLLSAALGLLAAAVGSGEDFYPRLTLGTNAFADGFPIAAVVLGVLIVGGVFARMEEYSRDKANTNAATASRGENKKQGLTWRVIKPLLPYIGRSALIGTAVGTLPGIGSTLAATLGYVSGRRRHEKTAPPGAAKFGEGVPEAVASCEAANSSVSGANLIPVLSIGIPGNAAAVFLILAMDSIGGFNPGPSVFQTTPGDINPELVAVFGIFTAMFLANILNWSFGGVFMRAAGMLANIPGHLLLPAVLLVTFASVYVQETNMAAVWATFAFGALGYGMRRCGVPVLPFIIAFILGGNLERTARQAFDASGGEPWFLLQSPVAAVFVAMSFGVVFYSFRNRRGEDEQTV